MSGKKKPYWWKEQFLSDKRSYFQNQNAGTEKGMSSREKLDPLSQGRKQIAGKKHTNWKATGGNGEGKA